MRIVTESVCSQLLATAIMVNQRAKSLLATYQVFNGTDHIARYQHELAIM